MDKSQLKKKLEQLNVKLMSTKVRRIKSSMNTIQHFWTKLQQLLNRSIRKMHLKSKNSKKLTSTSLLVIWKMQKAGWEWMIFLENVNAISPVFFNFCKTYTTIKREKKKSLKRQRQSFIYIWFQVMILHLVILVHLVIPISNWNVELSNMIIVISINSTIQIPHGESTFNFHKFSLALNLLKSRY